MLLASSQAGDFESGREGASDYMAQLLAAQQQAAAAMGQEAAKDDKPVTSASPSASSDSSANFKVNNGVLESKTNLIINYLPQTMSQDEVRSLFASVGPIESCKLVRDKQTGQSLGYAFVNYCSADDAARARQQLHGLRLQNKTIKVSLARPSHETIKGANLYVSGLPKSLTQPELEKLFHQYGNIITSRILSDNVTGLSKGVGFVRFDRKSEAEVAIEKMNGTTPPGFTEPIQVKFANNPATSGQKGSLQVNELMVAQAAQAAQALAPLAALQNVAALSAVQRPASGPIRHQPSYATLRYNPLAASAGLPANVAAPLTASFVPTQPADLLTTQTLLQQLTQQQQLAALNAAAVVAQQKQVVGAPKVASPGVGQSAAGFPIFVYNIGAECDDSTLWRLFGPFGAVLNVNPVKDYATNKCKGYAFVTMANYEDALAAITNLNGTQLNGRQLQVTFKSAQNAMYR